MQRFQGAVDATLEGLFPATVTIGGTQYAAAGVGGSALQSYLGGGAAQEGTRFFRIRKSLMPTRPSEGAELTWDDAEGSVWRFTLMEVPDRPHETSWMLRCEPKHR